MQAKRFKISFSVILPLGGHFSVILHPLQKAIQWNTAN